MAEVETSENLEFEWGIKKGRGGKNKDVQFYESFTYDGVEYCLYDSVYLYKAGELEPEIGKLVKIWETGDKAKKVKVLWFFRPCEISNFLGSEEILENELFLASGEGVGLANLNPLEAIAGKCNVLCISKDKENPKPSDKEFQMADFVFRRTFDVGQQKIMDNIDGKIAGIDVKLMFNRMDIQKPGGVLKVDLGKNEVCGNAIESNQTMAVPKKNSSKEHISLETNGNGVDSSTQEIPDLVKEKPSVGEKPSSDVGLKSGCVSKTNQKGEHVSTPKVFSRSKAKTDEGEVKHGKVHVRQVEEEEKAKCIKDSDDMANRPTKKAKLDNKTKVCHDKGRGGEQRLVEGDKKIRSSEDCVELDVGQSKMEKLNSKKEKYNTATGVVKDKVLSSPASILDDKCKLKKAVDSPWTNNDLCKNTKPEDEATMFSKQTSQRKLNEVEDSHEINEHPSKKMKKLVDKATMHSNSKLPKASQSQLKGAEDSLGANEDSSKKIRLNDKATTVSNEVEDSLEINEHPSKKMKKLVDKLTMLSNSKLPKASQSQLKGVKDSLGTKEDSSKKIKLNDKATKVSNDKLSKTPPTESQTKAKKNGGAVLKVTRRPDADRRTWFKEFPWEDRIQTAHEQRTLILLQNLDPAYTSAEVEDIVWHGFKESCTARMIQLTPNSSPHSGQALVIFKTSEAAEKVVRELDEGCLLLSNGRPLVGSVATPCSLEKKPTFFGHLVIDKLRHQMQKETKEAISTSHCSQPNTIEYDMAMEWCLQQERWDLLWKKLYKQHGIELRKLKAELKAK